MTRQSGEEEQTLQANNSRLYYQNTSPHHCISVFSTSSNHNHRLVRQAATPLTLCLTLSVSLSLSLHSHNHQLGTARCVLLNALSAISSPCPLGCIGTGPGTIGFLSLSSPPPPPPPLHQWFDYLLGLSPSVMGNAGGSPNTGSVVVWCTAFMA